MATASASFDSSSASNTVNNERFNAEAAGWDSNVFVHQATDAAYQALKREVAALNQTDERSKPDVLEIGCGTGLLSLQAARDARTYVAIDAAPGMIDVLKTKLDRDDHGQPAPKNLSALCVLLEDPEDKHLPPAENHFDVAEGPRLKFDLILSHLVLHHVPDLEPLLRTMLGCLKPGGQVALTDFEDFGPEAKKFHPQSKLVGVERHGIQREWMAELMRSVGFADVSVAVGFTVEKEVEKFEGEFGEKHSGGVDEGEMMDFPFLICSGTRPA